MSRTPRSIRALERLLPERFAGDAGLREVGRAPRAALGPTLRVLCWNILKARRADFAADFRRLSADRDLVLLQEAVLNAPSDALFTDDSRHRWTMARSFRDPRTGIEHGVKTGAAAPALEARGHASTHAEPFVRTPKMLLATRYALAPARAAGSEGEGDAGAPHGVGGADGADAPGAPTLLVLNMHAINFVPVAKYLAQLGQLAGALDAHAGPVLLAGDFNTWSVRRRASFFSVAGEARLAEAAMERGARLAHLNAHLDHVFYRGLSLLGIASLGAVASSDHAPIVATFEHRAPPESRARPEPPTSPP